MACSDTVKDSRVLGVDGSRADLSLSASKQAKHAAYSLRVQLDAARAFQSRGQGFSGVCVWVLLLHLDEVPQQRELRAHRLQLLGPVSGICENASN